MTVAIVHAGFHKTGTTTLQDFFAANRGWLASRGVHYGVDPGGFSGHHTLACQLSGPRHTTGPNDLFLPERETFARANGMRGHGVTQMSHEATELPVSLISSEILATFNSVELGRMLERLPPIERFVVAHRSGLAAIYALWAAKVRWGAEGPFDAFAAQTLRFAPGTAIVGQIDYVGELVRRVGARRVRAVSFEAMLAHPRGLAGSFLELELGLPWAADLAQVPISNTTPSAVVIELLRAVNVRLRLDPAARTRAVARVFEIAAAPRGELLASFSELISPLMRSLAVGDIATDRLERDGTVRSAGGASARLLEALRFPPAETARFAPTSRLLAALTGFAPFEAVLGGGPLTPLAG